MSFPLAVKGFLLRPFDERSMNETIAVSAFAHFALLSTSMLFAWLLPRYIEPFPSTRVEIVSEAELKQRLKAYRASTKTSPDKTAQQEQNAPVQKRGDESVAERVAVKTQQQTLPKTKKATQEKTQEKTEERTEEQNETIDDLLSTLEEGGLDEEATLDESLDEALAESEVEPSFLTSESVLTANELAVFRRHITQCWNPPIGAPALENLVVDLLLTLDGQAYVVDALVMNRARMTSDPFFRSAAEAALRTLSDEACSPLRLPLEKHVLWKKTILRFDPRSLFGK